MRKTNFTLKAVLGALAIAGFMADRAYAVIPVNSAASVLRNVVVVTGGNVTRATNFVTNIVATNLGINTKGSNDQTNRPAGVTVVNVISVTNLGNITNRFILKIRNTGSNGAGGGGAWGTTISPATSPNVAKGGVTLMTLSVTVPAGAGNGHEKGYVLSVSNVYFVGSAVSSNYLGDDGLLYGGMLKEFGASPGAVWVTNQLNSGFTNTTGTASGITGGARSNMVWSIRIRTPVIAIRKTAESIAFVGPGTGPSGRPVPGATITYKIFASNSGGGTGTGMSIYDVVAATNLIQGVTTSMKTNSRATAFSDTYATTAGANASGAGGDDQASYQFGNGTGAYVNTRYVVEFTPNSPTADNVPAGIGTMAANGGQFAGWFRVRIR